MQTLCIILLLLYRVNHATFVTVYMLIGIFICFYNKCKWSLKFTYISIYIIYIFIMLWCSG